MRRSLNLYINHLKNECEYSRRTIEGYERDLKKFIAFVESSHNKKVLPGEISQEDVSSFLEMLAQTGIQKKNCPASRRKRLSTIRTFFAYLTRENLVGRNPAENIRAPKVQHLEPDYLKPEEVDALVDAAGSRHNPFLALRDKAIISMFLYTGARVSELAELKVGDLDLRAKRVRLLRKGDEIQSLPLSENLISILRYYKIRRRPRTHTRAFFISIRGHKLTAQSVWQIVHDCGERANLPKEKCHPHTLRHTFATTLLGNGENLQTIRMLMNHKNIATTARYLHSQDEQLSNAVNNISIGKTPS